MTSSSPVPPKLDLADVHSQYFFQTPSSTSASSSLFRTISSSTRKRTRTDASEKPHVDTSADDDDLYRSSWLGRRDDVPDMDFGSVSDCRGQLPLAPPIEASVGSLTSSQTSGNSRKRSRRETWLGPIEQPPHGGVLEQSDDPTSPSASVGWGRSVLNAVEKVWNFCWSGAFRGFYAGGGRGYHMPPGSAPQLGSEASSQFMPIEKPTDDEMVAETIPGFYLRNQSTPIPGQYPEEQEMQKSWVVIPQTDGPADYSSLEVEPNDLSMPTKRVHRFSGTPGLSTSRSRPSALPRASKRSSLNGPPTPTRIPILSPGSKKSRESPVSAETQRYVAQMQLHEREEDASLRRLNRQLQMMIKEGQQALGTQVDMTDLEVENYH